MISNDEIINKWKSSLFKGRGYVLFDTSLSRQQSELTNMLIERYLANNSDIILYISMVTNKSIEITNQVKSIKLTELNDSLIMKQTCGLLILDTNGMSIEDVKNISNRITFKFAMVYADVNTDVRYGIKLPLINPVKYTLVNKTHKVQLTGIDKTQYDKYSEFISEKMSNFNIPEDELINLDGITNSFELIQACSVGRNNTPPYYYRKYLAELLGWDKDLDTSIRYMKEIDDNFNPHSIGEVANIIMGSIRGRNDILKNSSDKRKAIINHIDNNIGKSIIVIASSVQMAEDIYEYYRLHNINVGLYHNYIKSRTLLDKYTGKPIVYKSGKQAGHPKLFGVTTIKKKTIEDYNNFNTNIIITYGKLDDKFTPNRVDTLIIANFNISYDNVFYNANFIFPTNKTIEVIYIYIDEEKEAKKLKHFMYSNNIRQNRKRGLHSGL